MTCGAATGNTTRSVADSVAAVRVLIGGRVQGVGFRPFVYRAAHRFGIRGHVRNRAGTVEILAQGERHNLEQFIDHLLTSAPPLAQPRLIRREAAMPAGIASFDIEPSASGGDQMTHVPADQFVCDDCVAELYDPADRRFRYPFINCTQCGPRYTLIRALPYDRANTTMQSFELCAGCLAEYQDPLDRRFHAEPIACPRCGPRLWFREHDTVTDGNAAALAAAVSALRRGAVVAIKGIGGYHLMCDASSETAVTRLRERKHRPDKPFAVMFPQSGTDGLDALRHAVAVEQPYAAQLLAPARPIVLASKKTHGALAEAVAPGLTEIGVMLPYSPLHHLLLHDYGGPLVATSGNISGEPVLTDCDDAEARLSGIADAFLHHNREIVRPADDPVYRVIGSAARPVRLGRGVAPLEFELAVPLRQPLLAVGGHMKNTIALAWHNRIVISPHIGDLGTLRGQQVFERAVDDFQTLYGIAAAAIACDAHTGYASTRWAKRSGKPVIPVLHHHAHASAVAGEFPGEARWLVFTWDGTGSGEDGTLWGGEALLGAPGRWQRVASMRRFPLPGGDRASMEPWRVAAALCWETGTPWPEAPEAGAALQSAMQRQINSPMSSAVGRLFDAAAALTGLVRYNRYDGHGPMRLEAAATFGDALPLHLAITADDDGVLRTDWAPVVAMLLNDALSTGTRAACFHVTLAHALLNQATQLRKLHGDFAIGMAGGVFQNRLLTEQSIALLQNDGFRVYLPALVPVNDGGLCFGQIVEVASSRSQVQS